MENTIFLFVGRSGSGKSSVAARLSETYGWRVLDSYTTRPPRYEGEKGHIFSTKEEFDALPEKCAYTYFDGNEYCATVEQVNNSDIYIIDPDGITYFKNHYKGDKIPLVVYFDIDKYKSVERMADRGDDVDAILDRVKNDNSAFKGFNAYDLYFNSEKFTVDEIVAMIATLR